MQHQLGAAVAVKILHLVGSVDGFVLDNEHVKRLPLEVWSPYTYIVDKSN